MATRYDPQLVEPRWAAEWVDRGYFTADPTSGKPPFCIIIPPPNVTGELHLGHALGRTVEDTLVRWPACRATRPCGCPGVDHAGIATQNVVETQARLSEGMTRRDIGREAFVERVWAWKEQYGGASSTSTSASASRCDWEPRALHDGRRARTRRPRDFVRLYDAGLIYRGERIINWCPADRPRSRTSRSSTRRSQGDLGTSATRSTRRQRRRITSPRRAPRRSSATCRGRTPGRRALAAPRRPHRTLPIIGRQIPIVADEASTRSSAPAPSR